MSERDYVMIKRVTSNVEAEMIADLLKLNGIPSLTRYPGASAYAGIICGFTNLGALVYVNPEDEEKARDLLNSSAVEEGDFDD